MRRRRVAVLGVLLAATIGVRGVHADDASSPSQSTLVKQASAPISNILQIRTQDAFLPTFTGAEGRGNVVTTSVTMPLPRYRLLPFPQLSLLTLPAAVTTPGGTTNVGDLRFLDIAVLEATHGLVWGVGPVLIFPSAGDERTGQGKWQAGPAAAIAYTPERWLVGVLAQNPISFAGERKREDANTLVLQPFVTYQLGGGWFVRSQPQLVFNWKSGRQILPVDAGAGRVFRIGAQQVSAFVEPFWNASTDGPTPTWGVTFGFALLYPDFWTRARPGTGP